MSKFEIKNFIKTESDDQKLETITEDLSEETPGVEAAENNTYVDFNEIQSELDSLICNIDLNALINKYFNLDDFNNQLESLEFAQNDLYERLDEITEKLEFLNNERFVTFREKTKIYY